MLQTRLRLSMPAARGARGASAGKRDRRASHSSSKRAKQDTAADATGALVSDAPKSHRTREIFPPRENGAVGLPNRSGSDCFWLSTLQCIRHAPGYVDSLRQCTAAAAEQPVRNIMGFHSHSQPTLGCQNHIPQGARVL